LISLEKWILTMNYKRKWRDRCNANGFVAECARAALPRYTLDRRDALVAAIEIVEAHARGEIADSATVYVAADAAVSAAADAYDAGHIDDARVAYVAAYAAYAVADDVSVGAVGADIVNVDSFAASATRSLGSQPIQRIYVKWVAKDLGVDLSSDQQLNAAIAALVADSEDLLQTIGHSE
jgi:hypothetical protein